MKNILALGLMALTATAVVGQSITIAPLAIFDEEASFEITAEPATLEAWVVMRDDQSDAVSGWIPIEDTIALGGLIRDSTYTLIAVGTNLPLEPDDASSEVLCATEVSFTTSDILRPVRRFLSFEDVLLAEAVGDLLETTGFPADYVGKSGITLPSGASGQSALILTTIAIKARMDEISQEVADAQARLASGGINPEGDQAIIEARNAEFLELRARLVMILNILGLI